MTHYSRQYVQDRIYRDGPFTIELDPDDTMHDPETGDWLLGAATVRVDWGTHPGPPITATFQP